MALRIVVVGLGQRGRQWVEEVDKHPDWELAGGVEVADEPRKRAEAKMADRPVHSSIAGALTAPIDAAVVAVPAEAHRPPTEQLLRAGVPVLVEKPFATSLADAMAMVEVARSTGLPLLVGQNHRYLRSHRTVRELIQNGTLGDVRLTSTHYYRVPHEMAPSLAHSSNRIMWGMGVHHLDALRWSLGRDVAGVFARSFNADPTTAPDGASLHVLLEFEGGAHGVYSATYESSGHEFFEGGQEFYERIVGSDATLHVFQRWVFLMPRGGLPKLVRRGKRAITEEAVLLNQLRAAIRDGTPADCSGQDNLKTMAVVEACLRSAGDGTWIDPRELSHVAR